MRCPACGHSFEPELRTTGKYSQNHAEWGFSDQIARWMADGTTKREVLVEAMVRAGVDPEINHFGRRVMRESSLTKELASRVIEELRQIADFVGCRLTEVSE